MFLQSIKRALVAVSVLVVVSGSHANDKLNQQLTAKKIQKFVSGELLVITKNKMSGAQVNQLFAAGDLQSIANQYQLNPLTAAFPNKQFGSQVSFNNPLARTFKLSFEKGSVQQLINALSGVEEFEYVEPNYIAKVASNDEFSGNQYNWGFTKVNAEQAWANGTTGAGVVVAVIDTGVDTSHEDLAGKVQTGWNVLESSTNVTDAYGHGTHLAGIIAANADNGIGIAGVARSSQILPVKAMNDVGEGNIQNLSSAIIWATDNGADVINASWGGYAHSQVLKDAIDYAYNNGVTVVAAAGNENNNVGYFYPAAFDNTIAVGAINQSEFKYSESNYGAKIDVVAPGSNILSLTAAGSLYEQLGTVDGTNPYNVASGTSCATAYVTASVALSKEAFPSYSPDQLKIVVRNATREAGEYGWDEVFGYGMLDVSRINSSSDSDARLFSVLTQPTHFSNSPSNVFSGNSLVVAGSVGGVDYSDYALYATEVSNRVLTGVPYQFAQSSLPVNNAQLGILDTSSLAEGDYLIQLLAQDASGNAAESSALVTVDHDLKVGWPQATLTYGFPNGFARNALAVANLDQSGQKEIVATKANYIYAWNADGSALAGFPITVGSAIEQLTAPAIGDIDGDGDFEIVVVATKKINKTSGQTTSPAVIYAFHHNGIGVSGFPSGQLDIGSLQNGQDYSFNSGLTPPVIVDLNGDENMEIVTQIGSGNRNDARVWLLALNGDGTNYGSFPHQVSSTLSTPQRALNVGQFVASGDREILFTNIAESGVGASYSYTLTLSVLDLNGNVVASQTFQNDQGLSDFQYENVAFNNGGNLNILAVLPSSAATGQEVALLNSTLTYQTGWPKSLDKISGRIALADLDQNGQLDVLVNHGTWGDEISAWSLAGNAISGFQGKQLGDEASSRHNRLTNYGLVCSSDENGTNLGCFSSTQDAQTPGYGITETGVVALNNLGAYLDGWPKNTGFAAGGVTVADIENDNIADVVYLGTTGMVFVWQESNVGLANNGWSTYMANFARTGIYDDTYFFEYTGQAPVVDSCNAIANGYDINISGTASDVDGDLSLVQVFVDGAWNNASGTTSFTFNELALPVGDYGVSARAVDINANNSLVVDCGTVAINGLQPDAPIANVSVTGSTVTVSGTASDNDNDLSEVQVDFNNAEQWVTASGTSTWTLTNSSLGLGSHTVRVRAVDSRGNVSVITDAGSAEILGDAPTIDSINVNKDNGNEVVVSGTASDADGDLTLLEVEFDNTGSWLAALGTENWTITQNLADGDHTVRVRATDSQGNSTTSNSQSFKVGAKAPVVDSLDVVINGNSIEVKVKASDADDDLSTVDVRISGGNWQAASLNAGTWEYQQSGFAPGNYQVEARAVDATALTSVVIPTKSFGIAGEPQTNECVTDTNINHTTAGRAYACGTFNLYRCATGSDQDLGSSYTTTTLEETSPNYWVMVSECSGTGGGNPPNAPSISASVSSPSVTLSGTASDSDGNLLRVEVQFDNAGDWLLADGSSNWTYTNANLSVGNHTARARAIDDEGQVSSLSTQVNFTIEEVGEAPVVDSANASVANDVATVSGNASDLDGDLSLVEVRFSGNATWYTATGTNSFTYSRSNLPVGSYTATVRARDSRGEYSAEVTTNSFVIEGVAPQIASIDASIAGNSVTVSGTATDADGASDIALVQVMFDNNGTWINASGTSNWSYVNSSLAYGSHSVKARAQDAFGHWSAESASVNFTLVDPGTAPAITSCSMGANGYDVTVSGSASDVDGDLSSVEIEFNDDNNWIAATGTPSFGLTQSKAVGDYSAKARATDSMGNTSNDVTCGNAVVNGVSPALSNVNMSASGSELTVTGNASDADSDLVSVQVQFDNSGSWQNATGTGSWSLTQTLSVGSHNVKVRALDSRGNYSPVVDAGNETILGSAPVVAAPVVDSIDGNTVTVIGSASDVDNDLTSVEVEFDNSGSWHLATGTASWSITQNLSDGVHSVRARAYDDQGNLSAVSAVTGFTVGAKPPVMQSIDVVIVGENITVKATATDEDGDLDVVQVRVDGGAWQSALQNGSIWEFNQNGLSEGNHSVAARAVDLAGSYSTETLTKSFAIAGDVVAKACETATGTAHISAGRAYVCGSWDLNACATGSGDDLGSKYLTTTLEEQSQGYWAKVTECSGGGGGVAPNAPAISANVASPSVTLSGSASDNDGDLIRVEVQFDNTGDWMVADGAANWSYSTSSLSIGNHTARARAIDSEGSVSNLSNQVNFTIEEIGEAPSVDSASASVSNDTVSVTGTASDVDGDLDLVQVQFSGSSTWYNATGTNSWSYAKADLVAGNYTATVRARDSRGVFSTTVVTNSFSIEGDAPHISSIDTSIAGNTVTVSGTAADADGASDITLVQVMFDNNGTWIDASGTSSWSYATSSLAYGNHSVKARAQDDFGHWSAESNAVNFTLEDPGTAPAVSSCSVNANGYDVTASGAASDIDGDLATVEIEFNNDGNWVAASGTSSFSLTQTKSVGDYNVRARAIDSKNNTSSEADCGSVSVNGVAPTLSNINVSVSGSDVTITGNASDADSDLSLVQVEFDNSGTWINASGTTSWNVSQTGLTEGNYTVRIRARDSRNQYSAVEQRNFTIENQQAQCFTATNSTHQSEGRAYACGTFNMYRCAVGSDTQLGFSGSTTSLQEEPAGSGHWVQVNSCP